jgi:secreted PhoX family phosphatase
VSTNSSPAVLSTAVTDNVTFWAGYDETKVSPIARVDNVSFDHHGFMYVSTDGQPSALAAVDGSAPTGHTAWNDVLVGFSLDGAERGHGKNLVTAVKGCEVTGPFFTPDDRSLFLSIQHPGVDMYTWSNLTTAPAFTTGTWAAPGSAWNTIAAPGSPGIPRAATIVVRRTDGSPIPTGPEDPGTPVPELPMPALAVGAAAVVGGLVAFRHQRMSGGTAEA